MVITSSASHAGRFPAIVACRKASAILFNETPRGWLPEQLRQSAQVSHADSVSMVCEAITSDAATGLFSLEPWSGRIPRRADEISLKLPYTV